MYGRWAGPRSRYLSPTNRAPLQWRPTSPILWEYTSTAEADAYTVGASGANHGAEPIVEVGHAAGTIPIDTSGFVRIPVESPQNADVAIGYLTLSLLQPAQASGSPAGQPELAVPAADPLDVRACPASATWGEGSINEGNAPAPLADPCTVTSVDDDPSNPDKTWDVAEAVRGMAAGALPNNGFRLDPAGASASNERQFVGREVAPEAGPRLTAYYYLLTGTLSSMAIDVVAPLTPRPEPPRMPRVSVQVTVTPICGPDVSHRLETAWQVEERANPLVVTTVVIPPEGPISESTHNTATGVVSQELSTHAGGLAQVRVLLRDALGRESAVVQSVELGAVPAFVVEPQALTFTVERGRPVQPQSVSVREPTNQMVFWSWEAVAEAPWIRPLHATGVMPSSVSVSVSSVGVPVGSHESALVFRDAAFAGCRMPVTISVSKDHQDIYLPSLRQR